MDISDFFFKPNSQFLTHRSPSGGLIDLKSDCTMFFHFYLENVVETFNDKDIPELRVEMTFSRLIFVAIV